jgi:catechol 2,3-dioxygenase-like lactoylglutathione lyase family enzyme
MTTAATPPVDCEQHATLSVSDVLAASDFYTKKLGFSLGFTGGEPPTMAGVNLGHVQIFLDQGTPSPKGCSVYFVIGDADELLARGADTSLVDTQTNQTPAQWARELGNSDIADKLASSASPLK